MSNESEARKLASFQTAMKMMKLLSYPLTIQQSVNKAAMSVKIFWATSTKTSSAPLCN